MSSLGGPTLKKRKSIYILFRYSESDDTLADLCIIQILPTMVSLRNVAIQMSVTSWRHAGQLTSDTGDFQLKLFNTGVNNF